MKIRLPRRQSGYFTPVVLLQRVLLLNLFLLLFFGMPARAQWLDWQDDTSIRLTVSSVANSDPEEKDMWAADLNKDGDMDLIVVRKQPFSNSTQPGKSNLLLMNINGVMTDQTVLYAPEFISNINFARDVFIADFDGDTWEDVVIANTFNQQPMYYRNKGADSAGTWLGLINESATRFPLLTEDVPAFCAVWGGDVTGDGHKDIYFINYKQNSTGGIAKDFLLINDGTGHFTNQSQARLGILRQSAFGTAVQIADMDNDGDKDIVKNTTLYNVAPWNARGVIVLFNNDSGYFTNWQNLVPANSPYMFEVGDFNIDGKKDVFVVDDGSDYLLAVDSFTPNVSLAFTKTNLNFGSSNGFGGNVHAADIDLDGDLDIGVADVDVDIPPCNSSRRMAIYKNNGGVFADPYGITLYGWADNNYDFAWLDINGDGLLDFITGFCAGYGVFMSDNCQLAPVTSDYDQDGLPDACDPCPANPDSLCTPPTNYPTASLDYSIARQWNELLLASIRRDFARPTVHARNLFHVSAAMWDAWSAYDTISCEFLLGQTLGGFTCPFGGVPPAPDMEAARKEAISFAAYRLLKHRFANSPQASLLFQGYDHHMDTLGYNKADTSTNYQSGNPAALGNYIAQCYIAFGLQDGSNEQNGYANTSYTPVNPPLNVDVPGNPTIQDRNRWQPLTLDLFIDQSGNPIPGATPPFLSPEWGKVTPFALKPADMTVHQRNGFDYNVYHDPGPPPLLQMNGSGTSDQYKWGFALVSVWSSHLDPSDSVMWDISPATQGNRDTLPATPAQFPSFYNLTGGGTTSYGHSLNPVTGLPYTPNIVPRGDYARVLAEFWADGPDSETPPGHWFTLFNYVSDHPLQTHQYKGTGSPLNRLEWDVKGYLALGGAMHDVAISVWGMKGWYDYIRPISAIRAMAALGQSSDSTALSYHPAGIPLIPGYIELVLAGDSLAGGGTNIGKIKLKAWRGHSVINNVDVDEAGSGWILAENWLPYQRPSFVTPPFAGYISGHSTYSRAAAEILTDFTGSKFFPGGLGTFTATKDEFLVFEDGPSEDITLQWATYQDAADESSLSRIWGGIHPPCDDIPGRKVAVDIAEDAFSKAEIYYNCCQMVLGSTVTPVSCSGGSNGAIQVTAANVTGTASYLWSNGATTEDLSGLPSGTYTVTVTYTAGCTGILTVTVPQPEVLTVSAAVQQVLCKNASTGSITVTVSGGTPPYSYTWNNGSHAQNRTALSAKTYTVTVTDQNQCQVTSSWTVTQPAASLQVNKTKTNVRCPGSSTGKCTAAPYGGTAPYTYSWNTIPVKTTSSISGLAAGIYTCTVTDSHGCTKTALFEITQPAAIAVSHLKNNVSVPGGNDGSVTVTVSGGTAPYTYSWSTVPVNTTSSITGLTAGVYYLKITDSKGCKKFVNYTIYEPAARPGMLYTEEKQPEILVYPNPGNGHLSVRLGSIRVNEQANTTLSDLAGRLIFVQHSTWSPEEEKTFDFSAFAEGIYYLDITTTSIRFTRKLVIQR